MVVRRVRQLTVTGRFTHLRECLQSDEQCRQSTPLCIDRRPAAQKVGALKRDHAVQESPERDAGGRRRLAPVSAVMSSTSVAHSSSCAAAAIFALELVVQHHEHVIEGSMQSCEA